MKILYKLKTLLIVLSLLVSLAIAPNIVQAASTTGDPLTDQLLSVAQAKLDAEYKTLISGNTADLTTANVALRGKAAEKIQEVADLQLRRNKLLAEHGQRYTKASSTLTVEKKEITKDSATVVAKESVTLTLVDKSAKNPVYTKETKTHEFYYVREADQWILTEDKQLDALTPVAPEDSTEKVTTQPISLDVKAKSKKTNRNKLTQSSDNGAVFALLSGTFDPNSAVNYAVSYWDNYNGAYRAYDNDCTNFTSQALNWSGWQHVGGWYDDPNYWWYSNNPIIQWGGRAESRSWINVHYFYFFARYSGRAYNAQYLTDFRIGDTLQVDFDAVDGWLDHNTIVTQNNGGGNIFLTYHSNDTLNKSIWDFIASTPGANYYGTLFYYQY